MSLSSENMLAFIPQRAPMVMVDQIIDSGETITRTKFIVQEDNIFVEDGYLKEPGLVENIAQTAAARAGFESQKENKPVLVGYIGAIKNLEIYSFPKVGDEIVTKVVVENQIFNVTLITGEIFCLEKKLAQCEMKIFINN